MAGSRRIRTDLALETTERFAQENTEIRGVEIQEDYDEEKDIRTTVVKIVTENGAKSMGRPQGNYITIEAPDLSNADENLHMTRHLIREYGLRGIGQEKIHCVSGIVPGVMAQTGMETAEIVQGIVSETKPDVVVAIDALAARSVRRLNRTIQITDTGIHPGSGVGNHRNGLTEENLQVKVIGIGVPTVVDAATIVHDSMEHLLDALEETEQKEFLEEMITPNLYSMFVTPKDVDETVKYLSFTISEGLNIAFSEV